MRWARRGEGEKAEIACEWKWKIFCSGVEKFFFFLSTMEIMERKKALLNWKVQLSQPWQMVHFFPSCCHRIAMNDKYVVVHFHKNLFSTMMKVIVFNYSWESAATSKPWKVVAKPFSSKLDKSTTKKFYCIHCSAFFSSLVLISSAINSKFSNFCLEIVIEQWKFCLFIEHIFLVFNFSTRRCEVLKNCERAHVIDEKR